MKLTPEKRRVAAWLFLHVSAALLPALIALRLRVEIESVAQDPLAGRLE